jgi:hypothetical protein
MVGINGAAFAQRLDGWEFLGATRIGGSGFDRDEINVGKRTGHFEKSPAVRRGSFLPAKRQISHRGCTGPKLEPDRFTWKHLRRSK